MTSSSPQPESNGLHPGDKLGPYDIVEQIGAGSASIVWKARDPLLDRWVAIKQLVVDPHDPDAEAVHDRFRSEAQLQKSVSDKHLVKVIDFVDESRGLFIIMEYVDGLSLEQMLAQSDKPIDYRRVLGVVGATALALQVIHQKGIIHRDLKPSNILLPHDGGLKVADFGIAALLATQDALYIGSARYMAQELFGDEPVDGRSDIYSLGVIAYEMLCGRAAFNEQFKFVLRDQRNQALRWMKWHTNPRMRATALHELNRQTPRPLSDLVQRMMHKDPAQRIAGGDELIQTIRRHFAGRGELKPGGTKHAGVVADMPLVDTTAPTAALPQKPWWPWLVGAAVIMLVLAGGGWWSWQWRAERQRIHQHQQEARQAYVDALQYFLDGDYPAAHAELEAVRSRWPEDTQLQRHCSAYLLFCEAVFQRDAGRYDQALAKLKEADALNVMSDRERIEVLQRDIEQRAAFGQIAARIAELVEASQFDQARQELRILREQRKTLLSEQQERLTALGEELEARRAQHEVERVMQLAEQLHRSGQTTRALSELAQAQARQPDGRLERLEQQLRQERDLQQLLAQAERAERQNDLPAAIEALTKAQQVQDDDQIAARLRRLESRRAFAQGQELLASGQTSAAREAFTRALSFDVNPDAQAALERIASADQIDLFIRSGDAAAAGGDFQAALNQYENARKLGAADQVASRLRTAQLNLQLQRARNYLNQGQFEQAEAAFLEVQRQDPDNNDVRRGLSELRLRRDYQAHLKTGDELMEKGELANAKREYLKAKELFASEEVIKRIDDAEYARWIALGRHYMAQEDWSSARAALLSARKIYNNDMVRDLLAEVEQRDSNRPEG